MIQKYPPHELMNVEKTSESKQNLVDKMPCEYQKSLELLNARIELLPIHILQPVFGFAFRRVILLQFEFTRFSRRVLKRLLQTKTNVYRVRFLLVHTKDGKLLPT